MEKESWRRNHRGGIRQEESWRNQGGGIMEEEPWDLGDIWEASGGIWEASGKHLEWKLRRGTQEAPRGQPGGTQEEGSGRHLGDLGLRGDLPQYFDGRLQPFALFCKK